MDLYSIPTILAMSPPPPSGTQSNPTGEMIKMFMMLGLFVVMFYLVAIRPQQKKAKEHAALLKTLKPGDKVMTSGGVLGVVVNVKEKSATIRSADSKVEVTKNAITEIIDRGGDASAS